MLSLVKCSKTPWEHINPTPLVLQIVSPLGNLVGEGAKLHIPTIWIASLKVSSKKVIWGKFWRSCKGKKCLLWKKIYIKGKAWQNHIGNNIIIWKKKSWIQNLVLIELILKHCIMLIYSKAWDAIDNLNIYHHLNKRKNVGKLSPI